MSNTNRDYLVVCDVKNSRVTIARPMFFYVTDKNTSNIFVKLVTQIITDDGIREYVDIENATDYTVTLRVVKPNNETKSIVANELIDGSIYQIDLAEDYKDMAGTYKCELLIGTSISGRQELNTSDAFTYTVRRSIYADIGEVIPPKSTITETILNRLDALEVESTASNISIIDPGNYFESTNVEGALSEAGSQIKEKAKQSDLEIERARIDNFVSLAEGSTTGDAELIDGRIGADGVTYENIGTAIRSQFEAVNNDVNNNTNSILLYDSILDALKKNNIISVTSNKIANMLSSIENFQYSGSNLSISIKNNIIKINGTVNNFTYIKLTNGIDVGFGASGGDKKNEWATQTYDDLSVGESYSMKKYILSGTAINNSTDVTSSIAFSARTSDYTKVIGDGGSLTTLQNQVSYVQLYLPYGTYDNLKIGVVLQKGIESVKYTPNGYYDTSVIINNNSTATDDSRATKEYPTVINGSVLSEITGTYFNAIQGGCTDGEFIYCGIVQNQNDGENTVLHKIDIKTKTIVKTVTNFSLGHCNSMTYCDYDGYIHCVSLNNVSTIHRITTELEYIDSYTLNISDVNSGFDRFGAIDYNSLYEQFTLQVRGEKRGYAFFTKNFNLINIVYTEEISDYHAYGGICTDKDFIYQAIYHEDHTNSIIIYSYEGELIKSIKINSVSGEIEEPMIINNKMYATANKDYANHYIWDLKQESFTIL